MVTHLMPFVLAVEPISMALAAKVLFWVFVGGTVLSLAYTALDAFVEWAVQSKLSKKEAFYTKTLIGRACKVWRNGRPAIKMFVDVVTSVGGIYNLATQIDSWNSASTNVQEHLNSGKEVSQEYTLQS